jgi:hypothetical protein
MKVAIMQPYVFPYIGYFQLIKLVDIFVLYDDVNYIKQGWINRNKILVSEKEYVFTIPLNDASSFNSIKETKIHSLLFTKWKKKFMRTLEQSYGRTPHFEKIMTLINSIFDSNFESIMDLAQLSIINISKYLEINTKILVSSIDFPESKGFSKENRIVDIVKKCNSHHYINPIGGQNIYRKEDFLTQNIKLDFINSKPINYKQFQNDFVPWLSIIDVLMFNSVDEVNEMLNQYELI